MPRQEAGPRDLPWSRVTSSDPEAQQGQGSPSLPSSDLEPLAPKAQASPPPPRPLLRTRYYTGRIGARRMAPPPPQARADCPAKAATLTRSQRPHGRPELARAGGAGGPSGCEVRDAPSTRLQPQSHVLSPLGPEEAPTGKEPLTTHAGLRGWRGCSHFRAAGPVGDAAHSAPGSGNTQQKMLFLLILTRGRFPIDV